MANLTRDALRNRLEDIERKPVFKSNTDTMPRIVVSQEDSEESQMPTSSSYLMMDGSQNSRDVERWIHGGESATPVSTGVQRSRVPTMQRSTLTAGPSLSTSGLCYVLALMMPLFRANQSSLWRCSPSAMLNSLEPFFLHIGQICNRIRGQFRRLATDNMARELFSTAMDVIIVIYAMGFLFISMYEASIIG